MANRLKANLFGGISLLVLLALIFMPGCGGSGSGGGGGGNNPPAAPTSLTAAAASGQVSLTWTASTGATSYNVKRGTASGGPYSTVGSPTTTSYTDSSATNGTPYYYVVTAVNSNGESGNSSQASATPMAPPASLTATAGVAQVSLAWTASTGATGYNVKRGTATGGPYSTVGSPTTTSYVDSTATGGTKYYYVVTATNTNGESGNSNEASATPTVAPPAAPTGLNATAGDKQVSLAWTASTGAASYNVKRGAAHGGPYTTVSSPTTTSYADMGLTDGSTYYYVVTAVNSGGESAPSSEVSATPTASSASVHVTVDVLTNRHPIGPYVYGGAYPQTAATVTDAGLSVVRWGGNATSTYNWNLKTYNADNDYYFEDFNAGGFNDGSDGDSVQWIKDVKSAGASPLMTMVMLPWVAQSAEGSGNGHWTFSVTRDGAQCSVDQYNTDAGNGQKTDCSTNLVATSADVNDTYFPLLDDHTQTCPVATCVYRNDWAAALAAAFGSAPHFYDMDNEIDIWGGTHRDIHPNPTTYNELRDVFLTESRNLKTWDPSAIRLGPVSCCWYFYWRSATGNSDTSSHGGVDFLPWWLNEVAWSDASQATTTRSLDVFDIHAYPDADTGGLSTAQKQALAVSIYRDWWDPTFTSPASYIVGGGFSMQPVSSKPFRIPRMRAILNQTYPGTQLSITEWSAEFAGAADFSTALGDADAYGVLGRERVYLASRWTTPSSSNPNYLALKLYTNYDTSHHGFGTTSVSDTNDGNPSLFSSYAALNSAGTAMTLMVLNKDPSKSVTAQLNLNGFTPSSVATYTLAAGTPTTITKATPAWSSTMTFAPYSATLLVITGTMASTPNAEWDLNPDTTMVAAGGTVTLSPKITSTTGTVTLTGATSDAGINVSISQSSVTTTSPGTVTVTVPSGTAPGFYHFAVTGTDGGAVTQTQGGYIVVGNPAATITKTGDNGTGGSLTLTATLVPGSSGGTATGASIFFTTDKGTLSQRIVVTDSSGKASVTLTLPSGTGTAHVTAEGPYGLGHPLVTFTESN